MGLRQLLERGRNPVARKRTMNAAVNWVMWKPDRAQTVIITTLVVLLLAVAVFVVRGSMWLQTENYNAQLAQASAAAASPTTTQTLVPLASAEAPQPLTLPTATTGPPPDVEKAPQAAARAFLAAWQAAPRMTTQKAWLDALRPHTAPNLLALFQSTDRSKVPTASVGTVTSVTVPELHTSHVSAQMGGLGTVELALSDTSGSWLVTDINPGQ